MKTEKVHQTMAADYLDEALRQHPESPFLYTEIPEITHRHADEKDSRPGWEDLDVELAHKLVEEGERMAALHYPQILAADYLEFSINGNRVHFEEKYFRRRRMLTAFVMAECVENKGRFLPSILNGVYLILEENGWCLPAHNSYIRDTPQLPLQDRRHPVIDLFAAETAAILSVTEVCMGPAFDKISPFIRNYINDELKRRILQPYLHFHFWWMGGEGQMLNWTPWITQNVLLTILTRKEADVSRKDREQVIRQAAVSVDYFLDEYGEDGCCSEGAQYFSHAGLCLFGCLHILEQTAGERFGEIFRESKIHNIASYILHMYVGGGYYINFADCSPFPGHRSGRDFLFACSTQNRELASFAAEDYRSQNWEERLDPDEENLWYHILGAFTHTKMMEYPLCSFTSNDIWYPSIGLLVARKAYGEDSYVLAAKAGNNADSHNHNDVGSVTLYKNNKPFLIDLGVETYTAKTFSAQRYDIWTMRSQFHNLPTFYDESDPQQKPIEQKAGVQYKAEDVKCVIDNTSARLFEDIAASYGDERVKIYTRTVVAGGEYPVIIRDHYEGSATCTLSLMLYEEPVLTEKEQEIRVGTLGRVIVKGAGTITIEKCEVTDPRLQIAWRHDCYRVLITMKEQDLSLFFD